MKQHVSVGEVQYEERSAMSAGREFSRSDCRLKCRSLHQRRIVAAVEDWTRISNEISRYWRRNQISLSVYDGVRVLSIRVASWIDRLNKVQNRNYSAEKKCRSKYLQKSVDLQGAWRRAGRLRIHQIDHGAAGGLIEEFELSLKVEIRDLKEIWKLLYVICVLSCKLAFVCIPCIPWFRAWLWVSNWVRSEKNWLELNKICGFGKIRDSAFVAVCLRRKSHGLRVYFGRP